MNPLLQTVGGRRSGGLGNCVSPLSAAPFPSLGRLRLLRSQKVSGLRRRRRRRRKSQKVFPLLLLHPPQRQSPLPAKRRRRGGIGGGGGRTLTGYPSSPLHTLLQVQFSSLPLPPSFSAIKMLELLDFPLLYPLKAGSQQLVHTTSFTVEGKGETDKDKSAQVHKQRLTDAPPPPPPRFASPWPFPSFRKSAQLRAISLPARIFPASEQQRRQKRRWRRRQVWEEKEMGVVGARGGWDPSTLPLRLPPPPSMLSTFCSAYADRGGEGGECI